MTATQEYVADLREAMLKLEEKYCARRARALDRFDKYLVEGTTAQLRKAHIEAVACKAALKEINRYIAEDQTIS